MPPELHSGRGVSRLDFRDVLVLSAVSRVGKPSTRNHEKPFVKALKKQNVLAEFCKPNQIARHKRIPHGQTKSFSSRCDSVLGWESKVVVFVPHRGAEGDHDVSDEEDASVAGVNGELAQLNREDENCKEDSLEFDLPEPTGANPHAQESHRSNMRQRRFTTGGMAQPATHEGSGEGRLQPVSRQSGGRVQSFFWNHCPCCALSVLAQRKLDSLSCSSENN
ncbi:hypothetical protein BaRGS_00018301 [Batillaria attramentaria]|uniref:Uncharacterized protein n=1 Tax=Batillaria attramentaria TaxID=370345 RepID=A0ABD0KTK6_9CAEN